MRTEKSLLKHYSKEWMQARSTNECEKEVATLREAGYLQNILPNGY